MCSSEIFSKLVAGAAPQAGCPPCISTPELGRAVAAALGKKPAILLTNHGIALTDSSLYDLVSRIHNLRMNAQIQKQAILLGGQIHYLEQPDAPANAQPQQIIPNGSGGGTLGAERAWEYWRQVVTVD